MATFVTNVPVNMFTDFDYTISLEDTPEGDRISATATLLRYEFIDDVLHFTGTFTIDPVLDEIASGSITNIALKDTAAPASTTRLEFTNVLLTVAQVENNVIITEGDLEFIYGEDLVEYALRLHDTITGSSGVDFLGGFNGNDTISGLDGDDYLYGGNGNDSITGGNGNDFLMGDAGNDTITGGAHNDVGHGGTGNDTLNLGTGDDIGDGAQNNDTLLGAAGNDLLNGGDGDDILNGGPGNDELNGGYGDDIFIVDADDADISDIDGHDEIRGAVSMDLSEMEAEIEDATLLGTGNFAVTGNDLDNHLKGNSGANTLDGGAGNDLLEGGGGNDEYFVDSIDDVITEILNAGRDRVTSTVNNFILPAHVDDLVLDDESEDVVVGRGNNLANEIDGNALGNSLFGLGGNDFLVGGMGNDLLNGGAGIDTMDGGAGDDTFFIDVAGETVTEAESSGTDSIWSSITYSLASLPNIENLRLIGTGNTNATGNAGSNELIGNAGNNVLNGMGGADHMEGGAGNDTYIVNDLDEDGEYGSSDYGDTIEELAEGGGTDTVKSSVDFTLGDYLENLTLTGAQAIDGTGNELANVLVGNAALNTLRGGGGNDSLYGKGGSDSLQGGEGADRFHFDTALNAVTNADAITDFTSGSDKIVLSKAIFTKLTVGTLAAGQFRSGIGAVALDANDFIVFDSDTGSLYYDSNGSAAGGSTLIAQLAGEAELLSTDIIIVS